MCSSACVLLCDGAIKELSHKSSIRIILCNNYVPTSDFYLNHECLGNKNVDQEIDAGFGICYVLNPLMVYGL